MSANKDHAQMFARIRLHGLTKSSNGNSCPIDLERRHSFPMPADYTGTMSVNANRKIDQNDKDLSPRSLAPRYDIEARVCFDRPIVPDQAEKNLSEFSPRDPEGALGAGRAGIVYPLEILSVKHAACDNEHLPPFQDLSASSSMEPPSFPPLCMKLAMPGYVRNLAREAWFYEQFDLKGLTGLITPRCYGVFHTSNIPDDVIIDIPGFDYYKTASKPMFGKTEPLYTACMPEEYHYPETSSLGSNTRFFLDDVKKSYTNSEWTQFRETPEVATMGVLIMDMLGPQLTIEDFERDWGGDLKDIYDHLLPLEFLHYDTRLPNVLKVPPYLQTPCPIHPNAIPGHRWNLTDWEDARILGDTRRSATWVHRSNLYHDYHQAGGKQKYKDRGTPKRGNSAASTVCK